MPRGTGSFRLKPVRDVRGRVIYRNNAIALALMLLPLGALFCGCGAFFLITTCDAWRTGVTLGDVFALVFWLSSFLCGLVLATFGLRSLFGGQELMLDPVERQATFQYRRLRGNEQAHCTYDDLLLRLHALEFADGWRGFALAFHIAGKRFVVLQTAHRGNAEEIAAETQELTGIAWEHSEEPISASFYGLA